MVAGLERNENLAIERSDDATVADGATTILEFDITGPGSQLPALPDGGISGTTGNAMTITLAAGGTASVGRLSIAYTI